MQTFV